MPTNILMPALSPTMEKGNLAKWHVKEGDKVASGDVIAEIETDKATMEVEAVDEGTVGKLLIPEGAQDIAVNAVIAVLVGEGEDAGAVAAHTGEASPQPAKADEPAKAEKAGGDGAGRAEKADAAGPTGNGAARDTSASKPDRVVASPLARRLAKGAGIDLAGVAGSGPRGRIVKADVEAAQKSGGGSASASGAQPASPRAPGSVQAPSDDAILRNFAPDSYELVPHDGMRKTIARRLTQSKLTIPHYYVTTDVELDALLALRQDVNDAAPKTRDGDPAYRVSVNDFVIKALALALRAVPDANVSWTEGAMVRHKVADVGVAVAIPGGLVTPVVRGADAKPLSAIANAMKDFARRARDRKLKPEEYTGGSTAVSNLGMYGVKDFAAVINPPHATILAVGAGEQRAVVREGAVAVATVMSVTLSADHRAVDGAVAAELLRAFKGFVEKPIRMLV